ncbi:hypothetical protein B0H13DRAFT_2316438 [Mycena leptocephala]|nr:hypothetical protein B0H13DRAFT_2316438 [Mycena leptocephala]
MATNTFIPKPRWSASKTKSGSNTDLLKVMPRWTEQDFQKFKEHVQTEPAKWQKLVDDCRRRFPALDEFEGYWPIDIYYSKYVYWHAINQRRKSNSQKQTSNITQPSNTNSQKRKERPSDKEDEQDRANATNKQSISRPIAQDTGSRAPTQPQLQAQATSGKSISAGTHADNLRPSLLATEDARASTILVAIIRHQFCASVSTNPAVKDASAMGPLRPVRSARSPRPELRDRPVADMFQRPRGPPASPRPRRRRRRPPLPRPPPPQHAPETRIPNGLASAGKMTYVEKIEILDMLETYQNADLFECEERARKVQLMAISRPSEVLENFMALHTSTYGHVKRHMKIVDDEEYFELVDLVERNIPRYLSISIPIEEQKNDKLDALVTSICEKMPSLRKYDGIWPIHLHIRRFLSARAAGLPRTPRENETSRSSTTPSAPPKHECPVLSASPPSPVPPSVVRSCRTTAWRARARLSLSWDHFGREICQYCYISTGEEEFIAGLPGPLMECTEFQTAMIRYIVERV